MPGLGGDGQVSRSGKVSLRCHQDDKRRWPCSGTDTQTPRQRDRQVRGADLVRLRNGSKVGVRGQRLEMPSFVT